MVAHRKSRAVIGDELNSFRFTGVRSIEHHHLPDWDPPASWPWDQVCTSEQGQGVDCSNFTGWLYNWCFGVQLDTDIDVQSVQTTVPVTGAGSITLQRIDEPAGGFAALVSTLQPGDLCFVHSSSSTTSITHVFVWLGTCGAGPSSAPLVLDATSTTPDDFYGQTIPCGVRIRPFTSGSWYYTRFSHAYRVLR
ncbi:MAG: hypothetical protein EBV41_03795 [Actinobacteria bacterium]|nr:hypothetical protein [Actinomycetota bacterium]